MFEEIIAFIRELYHQPTGTVPLHQPHFGGNEKRYLNECIDSTFVSSVGEFVDRFETEIASYTGASRAVACVNGTSALCLALRLVGVKPRHEVITQSLTFVATVNAIAHCKAEPVFVDVDRETMGLSPNALEKWLRDHADVTVQNGKTGVYNKQTGNRISACVPMHTFGHPCRIDEIVAVCRKYGIAVVEDAAESLGSFYKDRHTGLFGEVGVLSFNGNKVITTGGGGVLLFKDNDLALQAKHLTTQAKTPHPWAFVHDDIGYNYRMPNINAALGIAQYEQLPAFLESKRRVAGAYRDFFSAISLTFVVEPQNARSNYWLNAVLLNDQQTRDAFLKDTNNNGVMTRPVWELMNRLPMYEKCQTGDLTNAIWLAERLVNLPSSVRL